MNALFWQRMHGGSTHFPIALLLASVVFDFIAWRSGDPALRRGLQLAGLGSAVGGVLGGTGAVVSGLVMSRGEMLGSGYERLHHLFVWPAFSLCVGLVAWRWFKFLRSSQLNLGIYLTGMSFASALMMGAGYWGGEMLLGEEIKKPAALCPSPASDPADLVASGDEGPNLHEERKSNARIAELIKNGVKGQMPRFSAKLSDSDVQALTAY